MEIIENLRERTAQRDPVIVLPEAGDSRINEAANYLAEKEIARIVLLSDKGHATPEKRAGGRLTLVEVSREEEREPYVPYLLEKRKKDKLNRRDALNRLSDPLCFAACMVGSGSADGCVAGAVSTTAEVIRSALRYIGMREGISLVSSIFLMNMPDGRVFTYGDCGVVPYPDPDELAGIALESARSHKILTGEEPRVAMLSFSTKGSAEHERVKLVREAVRLARRRDSGLMIDGELQFDAALLPEIARSKSPGSKVAGRANVFIFPNLDAGNIAYKITERLAGAGATGPILQGLSRPMMDLSRGCAPDDIVNAACVASVLGEGVPPSA